MGKLIAIIVLIAAVAGGYYFYSQGSSAPATEENTQMPAGEANAAASADSLGTTQASTTETANPASVKEFTMTAYYDSKGKWFSLKDMSVKKGDTVRVKITNTAGMHDFVIDEYGIKKDLPLNEEVVVEFVADKVGSFEYYCSMPGHRAGGQVGTLVVAE